MYRNYIWFKGRAGIIKQYCKKYCFELISYDKKELLWGVNKKLVKKWQKHHSKRNTDMVQKFAKDAVKMDQEL